MMTSHEPVPYWDRNGEPVFDYKDSWHSQVLNQLTSFAHKLLSREITDLSGEEMQIADRVQVLTPDVAPTLSIVFFYGEDLETIEKVTLMHPKYRGVSIDIPPPLYSVWQED